MTQLPWEHISIGGTRSKWPDGARNSLSITGALDSIRFSSSGRYTSSYSTPTTKLASDADTLLLDNFSTESTDFSTIDTSSGKAWLPTYPKFDGALLSFIEISHLEFEPIYGIGLWMNGVTQSHVHDLTVLGGTMGIACQKNCFQNTYSRLAIQGDGVGRGGLTLGASSGLTRIVDSTFDGWPVAIAFSVGTVTIENVYVHGERQVYALVAREGQLALIGASFSNEDLSTSTYRANVLFAGMFSVDVSSGVFERTTTAGPSFQVDGGRAHVFTAPHLILHPGTTAAFDILSAPASPVLIVNGYKNLSAVPWSTSGQVRVTPSVINTLPQRASGFGGASVFSGGTDAFTVNVGAGGSATSGVIAMPPAPTGWICRVNNLTAAARHRGDNTRQTATTTTSVTIENQTTSSGSAVAWTASDVVQLSCEPY